MGGWPGVARLCLVYLLAGLAGYLGWRIGMPLPWMIGPLLMTAALILTSAVDVVVPVSTRPFGQATVAVQVGLYFTPAALASLLERAPLLVGTALLTVATSFVVAIILSRLASIRLSSALVATLPTSPVEASVIAERHDIPPAPVILVQTMRIAAVVVLIPIAIFAIGGTPDRALARTAAPFDPAGVLLLGLVAWAGALAFRMLRISNANFLGPLALASAVTAAGIQLTPLPAPILWAAQIVLGTWLGSAFRPGLFLSARRMAAASVLTTLLFIVLSALSGVLLARLLGLHWETMVLAAAPGGVTEMALTASFMGSNVALVTAFHITRIFLVVPCVPWIIGRLHHYESRRRAR